MTRPWPAGAATGIGSLPGTDPGEAARLIFGELPELPHVPELPARGAGADMIGRTAALLVDLPVELGPSGWRFTAHPGRDLRRSRDFLAWDLDAVEDAAQGHTGALKLQIAGPWTLAAAVELANGNAVVSDPGASRDLAASLAEGLRLHLADVAARVPGAQLVVQVDEPSVDAVLSARVPTPSGYGTLRAVAPEVVETALRNVLEVAPAGGRVVHSCADEVPIELLRRAGADAISMDAARLRVADYDAVGGVIDAGLSLWLGVVPATDAAITRPDARTRLDRLWSALGFSAARRAAAVVPTPACGLAGATPVYARRALTVVREVGESLRDDA